MPTETRLLLGIAAGNKLFSHMMAVKQGGGKGEQRGIERGEHGVGLMLAAKLFALCQYSKTDFHMSFKFICAQA